MCWNVIKFPIQQCYENFGIAFVRFDFIELCHVIVEIEMVHRPNEEQWRCFGWLIGHNAHPH